MNRQARRAEEARTRAAANRHAVVREMVDYIVAANDPTISGCTIMLADGETFYLDAAVARAMKPAGGTQ